MIIKQVWYCTYWLQHLAAHGVIKWGNSSPIALFVELKRVNGAVLFTHFIEFFFIIIVNINQIDRSTYTFIY